MVEHSILHQWFDFVVGLEETFATGGTTPTLVEHYERIQFSENTIIIIESIYY